MAKHKKKKKHAKSHNLSDDLFSTAAQSIKRFRQVTNELSKLSTGQKLVGGLVLAAAGLIYLEQRRASGPARPTHPSGPGWPHLLESRLTSATEVSSDAIAEPAEAEGPRKRRKGPKPGKAGAARRRIPGADELS